MIARLTMIVWVAWLGMLGLMAALLIGYVPHPHFFPMTALLAVLIVAGSALIGGALWRLIRGSRRGAALTCLLLGVAPLGFLAGHILYGLKVGQGRQISRTPPLLLLVPFGESILDLEARFRYPVRTAGAKVVMIAKPDGHAREQVAAMDRHVRALEARLGRPMIGRVHWARGPLFGMQGKAIVGLCMGSRPGENPADGEGLTQLDRHEVAHCVIAGLCNLGSDPPSVLSEGWAEANTGHDPAWLARRAREHFEGGEGLSLRELTGPDWYGRHHWPAYIQGAVLVDYLLRLYGPERFLALYTSCRRATFAGDCRRILGVGLDDLDAAYRADVDRIAGDGPGLLRALERIRTGPGLDPAAWKAFLAEYSAAADALLAPYRQVAMTTKFSYAHATAGREPETSEEEVRYVRSGGFRSDRRIGADFAEVILAHPERPFQARRNRPTDPWEVRVERNPDPARTYRRLAGAIDRREFVSKLAAILVTVSEELANRPDSAGVVVTKLERYREAGHPRARVRLEDRTPGDGVPWRAFTAVLSPDDHFAALSDIIEGGRVGTLHGAYSYDRYNGLPVLRACVRSSPKRAGGRTTRITVVDRRFDPPSESELTRERLLDGPWIEKVADPDESYRDPTSFTDWYGVPLVAGAASLLAGATTAVFLRTRRATPGEADSPQREGG